MSVPNNRKHRFLYLDKMENAYCTWCYILHECQLFKLNKIFEIVHGQSRENWTVS